MTHAFDRNGNLVRTEMENGVERVRRMRPWINASRIKDKLSTFVPTEQQLQRATAWLIRAGEIADRVLKIAVILAVIFLFANVAIAFLPGGAAARVIGGAR
jgi:hypothetical protein